VRWVVGLSGNKNELPSGVDFSSGRNVIPARKAGRIAPVFAFGALVFGAPFLRAERGWCKGSTVIRAFCTYCACVGLPAIAMDGVMAGRESRVRTDAARAFL